MEKDITAWYNVSMDSWVALLDCNNFFVSCERLFRPDLVGKSVIVLSSNDGCVVARSQEVKDIGIPMGVPYFKIKDIIETNNIQVFSGNPTLYRDISKRVFKAMKEVLDDIEQYSVDEAFFVIKNKKPEAIARKVKDKVEQMVGVPVSIGVARSKTLAKLASKEAKKTNGVFFMNATEWERRQSSTLLSQVWGIGGQMSKRLRAHGLETVQDLLLADTSNIQQLFGIVGVRLKNELSGVKTKSEKKGENSQKSLMSSRTLKEATEDIEVLRASLAHHINHVAEELRGLNLKARHLKVYISPSRFGDFALQNAVAEVSFDTPTNVTSTMLQAGNKLLDTMFKAGVPYKKLGVLTSDLASLNLTQLGMFETIGPSKIDELQASIDVINKTAGTGKIQVGTITHRDDWKPRSEQRSPAYTTKWTDLATVKAQ